MKKMWIAVETYKKVISCGFMLKIYAWMFTEA